MLSAIAGIGRFSRFGARVGLCLLGPGLPLRRVLACGLRVILRCVLPVVAVCAPFGMVLSIQGLDIFSLFGAQRMLSGLVSVAILRELAPVLACVLVAAQAGSACAAELGAMRIKEELDATEVMSVDSVRWHVLPWVLGLTLASPVLNVAGAAAGLLGAGFTAVMVKGEPRGTFLHELWSLTTPADLWMGPLKTLVFGACIGLVASYHGFFATGGAAGVGRAVNDTVVRSVLFFIVVNYFLTSALLA